MRLLGKVIGKFVTGTETVSVNLTAGVLACVTLLMTYEIIGRFVINKPFFLAELFIMMMMAAIVFLTWGSVTRRDEHIRIGFFISKLMGDRAKPFMYVLESIAGVALSAYITYAGVKWIQLSMKLGHTRAWSTNPWDEYPVAVPHMVVCVGMGVATIMYLARLVWWVKGGTEGKLNLAGIVLGGIVGAGLAVLILRIFDWDLMISGSLGSGAAKIFIIYALSVFFGSLLSALIARVNAVRQGLSTAFMSFVLFVCTFITVPMVKGIGIDEKTIAIMLASAFVIAAVAGSAGGLIWSGLQRRKIDKEKDELSVMSSSGPEKL